MTAAGTPCGCFHGGLLPEQKKDIQQRFMTGDLAVIAATNAFGMGVDKPDIRVVIHADIPGSLENYLQEAGRAGRDGDAARCVLLFDPEDVESQFRLSATSQLMPRDFVGLLKAIRSRVQRFRSPEIVVSATELLADSEGTAIDIEAPDASTKVTTAVAWLERSGFLQRNENNTRVFPASLRVPSLDEALQRIQDATLPSRTGERLCRGGHGAVPQPQPGRHQHRRADARRRHPGAGVLPDPASAGRPGHSGQRPRPDGAGVQGRPRRVGPGFRAAGST